MLELLSMNKTKHIFINSDSRKINQIKNETINLVVTSPPYPMIKMWDWILEKESKNIAEDFDYIEFSNILSEIWKEMYRVIKPGGILAINIGDAARRNEKGFLLYSNSSKIINSCIEHGFTQLPGIIWSKPSNSPNKFLGSGMYPVKAYITLEHEHILIFRKGERNFSKLEEEIRKESAFFWEERNKWFSDIWTGLTGTQQKIKGLSRKRNAAYPLELPFRLINMFSIKGDVVLDPFMGTGTTSIAAAATERNSIGVDLMQDFVEFSKERFLKCKNQVNEFIDRRLDKHKEFATNNLSKENFMNENHNFIVKTKWEQKIKINKINKIVKKDIDTFEVEYN
ncbi:MAG: methyltransferase [Candidatus Tyloplasma litorale]|nr:MAG: methyltransferase [Mycoplasmatales bacterium]